MTSASRVQQRDSFGRLPQRDVLTEGSFHTVLVLLQRAADWPIWQVVVACLVLVDGLALLFWLITGYGVLAVGAGLTLLLFMAGDAILLRWLPRLGLSFGPWQSQLFALAVPRVIVTLLLAVPAILSPELALLLIALSQMIGTALLLYATYVEPFRLELMRLDIELDQLPPASPPGVGLGRSIRLLHISDLHVERLTGRERQLLRLVEAASPDLIVITGDYLNLSYVEDPTAIAEARRLLRQLRAPHGVFATLGSPPADLRHVVPRLFDGLPICLLSDDVATVELGHGRRLHLLGLDCTHYLPDDRSWLERLVSRTREDEPRVLLYHSPELMPEAVSHKVDLYLCGHTHGGQVRLPFYGALMTSSQLGKQYEMGHYHEGRTHLYVSRGVGMEGLSAPRVRFLCPPEMTLVTLRPAAGARL